MVQNIPKEVIATCFLLEEAGFEAYIVGGAVRDLLLERPVDDWDFTTNAQPEEIQKLFPEHFYENAFGTVGVTVENLFLQLQADRVDLDPARQDEILEITTFRSESAYSDHRRPDAVEWGRTLHEDLQRRDFTVNALALRLVATPEQRQKFLATFAHQPEKLQQEVEFIDPFRGWQDLQNRIIRCVGEPSTRFQEDALRMLRAIRLAAQLEFQIDQETLIAIQTHSDLIQYVSWERIRDEFLKILLTNQIETAMSMLYSTGLLKHILPELLAAKNVEQRGHHEYDVWTHSIRACQLCPSSDPIVKFAALLHDIAKPETQAELPDQPGEYSFHNHEVVGARLARNIARRFRLSKDDVQRVFTLVRWHMFYYQPSMTDAAIRRFMRKVGVENLDDMMALREGDRLGSGSKRTSWRLEEMKQRIHDQLHQPMKVTDLAIDGTDVMETLGIPPSRQVGDILNELFEEVLEDPEKNTREYLLERVRNSTV